MKILQVIIFSPFEQGLESSLDQKLNKECHNFLSCNLGIVEPISATLDKDKNEKKC